MSVNTKLGNGGIHTRPKLFYSGQIRRSCWSRQLVSDACCPWISARLLTPLPLRTYYGNASNTVAMAKYDQGLIGSGMLIKAAKHGSSQASSAIATIALLSTSSLTEVMTSIITQDPMMFGTESRLLMMTSNPRPRKERVKY